MPTQTFKDLEQAGWRQRADAYDDWFGNVTKQAIDPTLNAIGLPFDGLKMLDVCTGTGHMAGAAAARGALVEGLDFADEMVRRAERNYPGLRFRTGDAEDLPYDDGSFDAVVSGFGHLHLADADKAIREAGRVLIPRGRYAFTVWCGPDQGGEFFEIWMSAVSQHGTMDVPLPQAPPMFRFADPDECRTAMEKAGFEKVEYSIVETVWRPKHGSDLLDLIEKSVVRAPMVLGLQTSEARAAIETALVADVERRRSDVGLQIRFPAALIAASKG